MIERESDLTNDDKLLLHVDNLGWSSFLLFFDKQSLGRAGTHPTVHLHLNMHYI
jgi:hypothetical protein